MVPSDPAHVRPKLIHTDPTPPLLPQAQQQMITNYTSVTGPQSAIAPIMNQSMGVNTPQVLGNRQMPAVISLPITVAPPVPLYAQTKPSVSKPIDEVLQYVKYCSDEIELKQRKLKEKAMAMQIKAAQSGMQGGCLQQMVQQSQGNKMFQVQVRGTGRRGFVNRNPDLNSVVVQNDVQRMKKMLPCHACGGVGHWKRECPMMVQEGVVQQSNDVSAFQNVKGPSLRGPIPNFQNNMIQMQGLKPMQQVQMPRVQPMQIQQMQQQAPMVPRQQMQGP
ncbi:hypothetical protein NDU88_003792 [Pleurodeles waltl]|uniref:CCHC-type domain-containing protein n=1 Tax=Pleurodeles waltl TaxID=8319 RepID=A0AAV7M4F2_PLEWA|nr:hypothetical protein NDU88_003792 [Pleurodeles waltl]